jgi:hypothetical protein
MRYVSSREFKSLAKRSKVKDLAIRKDFDTAVELMPDRCVKFTISSDAVDRQSDRVLQDGWQLDNYIRNPVVLWGHNDGDPPVGKCTAIGIEDGKLKAVVQFLPESIPVFGPKAEAIYRMCCEGYLGATSVGFRPIEWQLSKDPERGADEWEPGADFIKAELVEFSIVSVPCNPDALLEATPQLIEQLDPDPADNGSKSLNTSTKITRERLKQWEFLLSL